MYPPFVSYFLSHPMADTAHSNKERHVRGGAAAALRMAEGIRRNTSGAKGRTKVKSIGEEFCVGQWGYNPGYMFIYIYIHLFISFSLCLYVCMRGICIYIYICVCVCIYIYVNVRMYINMNVCGDDEDEDEDDDDDDYVKMPASCCFFQN